MPPKGFVTLTIKQELVEKVRDFIERYNAKLGYQRWGSVQDFIAEAVEWAIKMYVEQGGFEGGLAEVVAKRVVEELKPLIAKGPT